MTDWKQRTIEQWTLTPCGWDESAQFEPGTAEFFEQALEHRYKIGHPWILRLAPFSSVQGKRVLEVGCGMGMDGYMLRRGGADYTAVDITPRHLELTRRHHVAAGLPEPDVREADAEALPFDDASFDLVFSNGVIHHTPDTEATVREMYRVLRPGGRAWVMVYHRHALSVAVMLLWHRLGRCDCRGLPAMLSRHIEAGASGDGPLVKVYSRGEVRRLFGAFQDVSVKVDHLAWGGRVSRLLFEGDRWYQRLLERAFRPLGFYLVIQARKPAP